MHTRFTPEIPIGIGSTHFDDGAFDTRFIASRFIEEFGGEAFALSETQIHPEEHLTPILSIYSTRPAVYGEEGWTTVIWTPEKSLEFQSVNLTLKLCILTLEILYLIIIGRQGPEGLEGLQSLSEGVCLSLGIIPKIRCLNQSFLRRYLTENVITVKEIPAGAGVYRAIGRVVRWGFPYISTIPYLLPT
jgi:hypothetical protein